MHIRRKLFLGALVASIGIILLVGVALYQMGSPLSQGQAVALMEKSIKAHLSKSEDTDHGIVSIQWPSRGINQTWAFERGSDNRLQPISNDTPFHVASVGKTFTTVLVMRLQETGRLDIDQPIAKYLPKSVLQGLFTYQGTDYSQGVTTRQLLAHTSGVADYFGDPVNSGLTTAELIVNEPNQFWTPQMMLDISRDRQVAVGKPGEKYHYSDTGYILLGLLVEALYEKPLADCLKEEIFKPLGMNNSYLMFYGKPVSGDPVALSKIWFQGQELSQKRSLSIDWAGGGIISTAADLQKFSAAMKANALVRKDSYAEMATFEHEFMTGIDYGLGLMAFDFEKFFFLLKGLPKLEGHMGVLSCFMLWSPSTDLSLVVNFGSDSHNEAGVKLIIELLQTMMRINN